MTVEELLAREAIRQTMARYNQAGDRLRVEDFLAVFTDDAVLESEGVPAEDAFHYAGKGEIRAWMERWSQPQSAEAATGATFVRHHLSTCTIDLTGPAAAKARTYWSAWTDIGPDHCGYYLDRFQKVGEAWLIAHRRVRLDWRSPGSLFTAAILNTN